MSNVKISTNYGDIVLACHTEEAPKTVENFLNYVKDGFYTNTIFHRVIPNFMIQGGGFEPGMEQKSVNAPIENEADNGLVNKVGSVAMARTGEPHSATAQFFINVKDNDFLNFTSADSRGYGYCVFAQVVDGLDVVEKIKAVSTGNAGMHQDVPIEDVIIQSASIID